MSTLRRLFQSPFFQRYRLQIIAAAVVVVLVAATAGFALFGGGDDKPAAPHDQCRDAPPTTTTTVPKPGGVIAPLTGLRDLTSGAAHRPALTIKVENTNLANPQIGLQQADVIYEEVVEGGITRLLAIFQSQVPEVVGPVRSVRKTDRGVVTPIGGIFVYSGGAAYAVTEHQDRAGHASSTRPAPATRCSATTRATSRTISTPARPSSSRSVAPGTAASAVHLSGRSRGGRRHTRQPPERRLRGRLRRELPVEREDQHVGPVGRPSRFRRGDEHGDAPQRRRDVRALRRRRRQHRFGSRARGPGRRWSSPAATGSSVAGCGPTAPTRRSSSTPPAPRCGSPRARRGSSSPRSAPRHQLVSGVLVTGSPNCAGNMGVDPRSSRT